MGSSINVTALNEAISYAESVKSALVTDDCKEKIKGIGTLQEIIDVLEKEGLETGFPEVVKTVYLEKIKGVFKSWQ